MTDWSIIVNQQGETLLVALKKFLGIDPADTTQDEELTRALNLAGQMVETYLDRVVAKREVTEMFQSHFGRVTLHNYPVDTAQDVTVILDGVTQSGYQIFKERWGLPHLTRQAGQNDMPLDWRNYQQVEVSYTAGFDPIPSDLGMAINYLANDIFKSEGTGFQPGGSGGSGAIKSMSIYDVGSISYDVGSSGGGGAGGAVSGSGIISDTVANMLRPYRRMSA